MATDPHHAYCCMVCRSASMLRAHRQLMSSTALKHRVSATVWGHQGDRLQYSSVDPPCARAQRHRQAELPHSRHMSCMDPPSATGTESILKQELVLTTLQPAARIWNAMLQPVCRELCRPARRQPQSRCRTPTHGTSRSGTVARAGSQRSTSPFKSLQRLVSQLFPSSPSDPKSAPQHADARCELLLA